MDAQIVGSKRLDAEDGCTLVGCTEVGRRDWMRIV